MLSTRRAAQLGLASACVLLVWSLGVLAIGSTYGNRSPSPYGLPTIAADFELMDTEGRAVRFSSLRGQVVVLAFESARSRTGIDWSERLAALSQRYADRDVKVLAIGLATEQGDGPSVEEVRLLAELSGRPYPTLLDIDGGIARRYAVEQMPMVVVVDEKGMIRYRGPLDDDADNMLVRSRQCEDVVQELLAERTGLTESNTDLRLASNRLPRG